MEGGHASALYQHPHAQDGGQALRRKSHRLSSQPFRTKLTYGSSENSIVKRKSVGLSVRKCVNDGTHYQRNHLHHAFGCVNILVCLITYERIKGNIQDLPAQLFLRKHIPSSFIYFILMDCRSIELRGRLKATL